MTLFALSCPFCYTQAASATTRFIHSLRNGILILVIPPLLMSIGFGVMAYRRRNTFYTRQ